MLIGYVRVSTAEQNAARQEVLMQELGAEKVFVDKAKGVGFISKKEAIDTGTPTGKFMLTVFAAVAELEREYILQRQREGIAVAKQAGKYKGRKPIDRAGLQPVLGEYHKGVLTATQAMRKMGVSRSTFYRLLAAR